MSESLIQLFAALPADKLRRSDGATPADIAEIENRSGLRLPADLRETLEFSDGLGIRGDGTQMFLYNAHDLAWTSSEPQFRDGLPGMLIIGTDGEGAVYYADPHNRNGCGSYAIYLVRMSDLDPPRSIFAGSSFADAVDAVLNNVDLYSRPELGEAHRRGEM